MSEYGFSLEEYSLFLKGCQGDRRLVWRSDNGTETEVFYVPVSEEQTEVTLPPDEVYQVSGNNEDGCIITVWRKLQWITGRNTQELNISE